MNQQEAEKYYKALANRRRIKILLYLAKNKRANVSAISGHLCLSFKSTSKHLQRLKSIGLITNMQIDLEQHYELVKPYSIFIKHLFEVSNSRE